MRILTGTRLVAYKLLLGAKIDPEEPEVEALAKDIRAIMDDELDGDDPTSCIPQSEVADDAVRILWQRIGGSKNLRGYVDTLLVKRKG